MPIERVTVNIAVYPVDRKRFRDIGNRDVIDAEAFKLLLDDYFSRRHRSRRKHSNGQPLQVEGQVKGTES